VSKTVKRTTKKAKPDGMSGDKLRAAIEKIYGNDQSQGAFARLIGVHDRTVRAWIGGRFPVPRYIAMLVNLMITTETGPEDLKP
jgi:DNA-binding transcriptional regulator YiaG